MYLNRDEEKIDKEKKRVNITVNGVLIEYVSRFKYLGQWITTDGPCDFEIKTRIEIARGVFLKMRDVFASRFLSL